MPNRLVRDANGVLAPKIGEGGLPDATVVNADIKVSSVQGSKLDFFLSAEQTGNGAPQPIAHGLGRTPSIVLVVPTDITGNPATFTEGAHDATNCIITATATLRYKVFAL
jgi:hypothetical protein